jgi:hypothetical protein
VCAGRPIVNESTNFSRDNRGPFVSDPKYAAFSALDPFFEISKQGLSGLVDSDHYFDTVADDAVSDAGIRQNLNLGFRNASPSDSDAR